MHKKAEYNMKLLRSLAMIFIDVFGITHPSLEARDRAATYIAFLMLLLIATCIAVLFLGLHLLANAFR